MRVVSTILAIVCSWAFGFAQTTIFSENMGTPAATTAITSYTGFQNYGTLTYTGTGDVRTSTPSSGYTGASGNGDVFLNTGGKSFQIENINTSSCSSFTLSFGVYKSTTTSNGSELLIEISTDGSTYSSLALPALPTGTGTAAWSLATITSGIPATSNLRIRFTNNSATVQFRIDDVTLTANCSSNTITTGAVSATNFTWTCGGSCTGTVAFTSAGSFNSGNVYSAVLSSSTGSFSSPITIGTLSSTANTGTISITIPWSSVSGTAYKIEVKSSSPSVTGSASSSFTITPPTCCPYMTGAVLNSCNNPGCNEGDAEIMFFNSGSYSMTVSSLPSHTINYYGNSTDFTNNTVDAYTGTVSTNSTLTSSLNSLSGCSSTFIDANAAGTIPAYSTFIMVPNNFCYSNYDFSTLCANFSPIYVIYFGTTGWNTSGNLANYQSGTNIKYVTADFSWVSGCSKEYYNYDAGLEYSAGTGSGDGASVAYAQPVSTASASPVAPSTYNAAGSCSLPLVLPVNLVEFKAEKYNGDLARVSFSTASEVNVKRYKISKSYDGVIYTALSEFNAHNEVGQFKYSSFDDISEGDKLIVYYRLSELDLDGTEKSIANCVLETHSTNEIIIYGNGEEAVIKCPEGIAYAEVFTITGSCVKVLDVPDERTSYHFGMSDLVRGIYLVSVTDTNGKIVVKKIVR